MTDNKENTCVAVGAATQSGFKTPVKSNQREAPRCFDPRKDLQYVRSFAPHVMNYLLKYDQHFMRLFEPHFMVDQVDLTETMRSVLVDWLVAIANSCGFTDHTLHLTVMFLDRYLAFNKTIMRDKFQQLGTACLSVASKFEEHKLMSMAELEYVAAGAVSIPEMIVMEFQILEAIRFNLSAPSPGSFVEYVARECQWTQPMLHMSQYLCDLTLPVVAMRNYSSATIAAAAIYLTHRIFKVSCAWPPPVRELFEHGCEHAAVESTAASLSHAYGPWRTASARSHPSGVAQLSEEERRSLLAQHHAAGRFGALRGTRVTVVQAKAVARELIALVESIEEPHFQAIRVKFQAANRSAVAEMLWSSAAKTTPSKLAPPHASSVAAEGNAEGPGAGCAGASTRAETASLSGALEGRRTAMISAQTSPRVDTPLEGLVSSNDASFSHPQSQANTFAGQAPTAAYQSTHAAAALAAGALDACGPRSPETRVEKVATFGGNHASACGLPPRRPSLEREEGEASQLEEDKENLQELSTAQPCAAPPSTWFGGAHAEADERERLLESFAALNQKSATGNPAGLVRSVASVHGAGRVRRLTALPTSAQDEESVDAGRVTNRQPRLSAPSAFL